MSFLTSWLLSVIGTAFLVSLCEALMPEEKVREAGRLVGGLLLLLALLSPLTQISAAGWNWDVAFYFEQVEEKKADYRMVQEETMEKGINERCAAYIEAAAQEMGLTAHAEVLVTPGEDGTFQIVSVQLDIPYHAALSQRITAELGVAPEQQKWKEEEVRETE